MLRDMQAVSIQKIRLCLASSFFSLLVHLNSLYRLHSIRTTLPRNCSHSFSLKTSVPGCGYISDIMGILLPLVSNPGRWIVG